VRLRRLWNLIRGLPPGCRLFVDLAGADRARWGVDQEMAWATVELLDVIARKGTKAKRRSLIRRSLRPRRAKRQPVSMLDPAARGFFGPKTGPSPPAP
jgi:hypothetical protein